MEKDNKNEKKKIVFFIGKKKYETEDSVLTVKQILEDYAKVNPEEKSLALVHGNDQPEYTDINEKITMKEGMHFVLFDKTPTTTS